MSSLTLQEICHLCGANRSQRANRELSAPVRVYAHTFPFSKFLGHVPARANREGDAANQEGGADSAPPSPIRALINQRSDIVSAPR